MGDFVIVISIILFSSNVREVLGACETRTTAVTAWYRSQQSGNLDNFYTHSQSEMVTATTSLGYRYEGVIGYLYTALPVTNGATIYRYWTSNNDHFYSINSTEYLGMAPETFTFEGSPGYCSNVSGKGLCPIYKLYNPTTKHVLLTTNYNEMVYWQTNGFTYQYIMCYILCNA